MASIRKLTAHRRQASTVVSDRQPKLFCNNSATQFSTHLEAADGTTYVLKLAPQEIHTLLGRIPGSFLCDRLTPEEFAQWSRLQEKVLGTGGR